MFVRTITFELNDSLGRYLAQLLNLTISRPTYDTLKHALERCRKPACKVIGGKCSIFG